MIGSIELLQERLGVTRDQAEFIEHEIEPEDFDYNLPAFDDFMWPLDRLCEHSRRQRKIGALQKARAARAAKAKEAHTH